MKIQLAAILSLACASACFAAKEAPQKSGGATTAPVVWKLKFTEDFKGNKLNDKIWTRIGPGTSDWNRNMSERPDLIAVKDGQLHAYGVKNDDLAADKRRLHTAAFIDFARHS